MQSLSLERFGELIEVAAIGFGVLWLLWALAMP